MSGRWEYPNFDPWDWDESGENDLTREARKMIYEDAPLDKEVLFMLVFDCVFCHMRIDALRNRGLKAKVRKLLRVKGDK